MLCPICLEEAMCYSTYSYAIKNDQQGMTVMVRPDWNEKAMTNIVGLKLKMTNQIDEFLVQTVFYG
jgi:hypothetical protein